jgi:hypothetical protein
MRGGGFLLWLGTTNMLYCISFTFRGEAGRYTYHTYDAAWSAYISLVKDGAAQATLTWGKVVIGTFEK